MKRQSPLDRAIAKLDADIAVLVAARERLMAQQPARLKIDAAPAADGSEFIDARKDAAPVGAGK